MKEKINLKNRIGQNIVGVLTKPKRKIIGTAILQAGHSGVKEQVHILTLKKVLLENNFQVFNFDPINSFGESDGEIKYARQGLHADDFEDVAEWVQEQGWFIGKLLVSGHSMGGFSVARYALRNINKVSFSIPFAPVISGELIWAANKEFFPDGFKKWKKDGVLITPRSSNPSELKEIPWEFMIEILNHSLIKENNENQPMLFIGCENDTSIPTEHISIFYKTLVGDKTFKIINGSPHTPKEEEHLNQLYEFVDTWLKERLDVL